MLGNFAFQPRRLLRRNVRMKSTSMSSLQRQPLWASPSHPGRLCLASQ
jgi:hypothetical protein